MRVLNIASPTPGDSQFYERWKVFGQVYKGESTYDYDGDCEILVVDQRTDICNAHLNRFPSLKYVCSATTGMTHLRFDWNRVNVVHLTDKEFLKDIRSVSEFVFRLIFEMVRPLYSYGQTLNGKTILIVGGLGRIGKHVAEIANGFRMHPILIDRDNEKSVLNFLELADFVTLHIPEQGNEKYFSEEKIARMKKTAILINTSRGSVVDEKALVKAILEERIAGAALDTISNPHDLLGTPIHKLIIGSHRAGSTVEDRIKTDIHIVEKLKRLIFGEGHQSLGSSP